MVFFDNKKRLAQELQRQKERELEQQRQEYEQKLKKQRARFTAKFKHKHIQKSKEKILSPLELYRQQHKNRQEIAEYQRERFKRGKIGRGITQYKTRFYGDSYIKQKPSSREIQLLKLRLAIEKARQKSQSSIYHNRSIRGYTKQMPTNSQMLFNQQLQARARAMGWNPSDLDCSAWDDFFISHQTERETLSTAQPQNLELSEAWAGSRAVNDINREVALFGNLQHINPSNSVTKETLFHSSNVDIFPTLKLESEVFGFANILNPNYKRKKK